MSRTSPSYKLLFYSVLFSLLFFSCRYDIDKYDGKLTGLWVHLEEEWELFDDNVHHYYFREDGTWSYMSGASETDSVVSGPFPYDLDGNVLTRYSSTGFRKDSITIKGTPAGKFMTLEYIGSDQKLRYKFLRKEF